MPNVADNADDFVPLLTARRTYEQSFANRGPSGEIPPRKHVTDQNNLGLVAHVGLGEPAADKQRNAHGSKIVVIDVANIGVRALSGGRLGAALDIEREV